MANVRHLENVCRLCLTDASEAGHMLPIFPVRGGNPNSPTSMVYRIYQCTSLKLEQKEGIPSTICELCSVRLEDWYAFREQCLGSDEYLRVALAHIYCTDVQAMVQPTPTASHTTAALNNGITYAQQHRPPTNEGASRPSPAPPTVPSPNDGPSSTAPRSSSLAKRRKSILLSEWSVDDGKGQATGQKVIVELLDDGVVPDTGESVAPPKRNDHQQTYEPILSSERPNGGETPSAAVLPEDASGLLEQATWSKEYCARVNSLMVLVAGTRPYKCKICRKLFKARSNLRRHIKVNHADEVFEGESPPPECYDFGHIDRAGGAAFWKPPPLPGMADSFASAQQQVLQQQRPLQHVVHHSADGGQVKKKRRSVNDPPITGPYQCQICPRSFKMPAHLAVHMKTHQRVEVAVVPSAIELQVQQQLLQRQSRTRTNIEPTDIIQLSDDDDEDNEVEEKRKLQQQQQQDVSRQSDELDDGFDEEEGSLKEGASSEQMQPDPASLAIVEMGPIKTQPIEKEDDDDDDDDVVIQDVKPALTQAPPPPPPTEVPVKPKRIPAPGTIPPGPLSMKQRYRASMESAALAASRTQSPHETKPKPFQFIVARPKHSPALPPPPSNGAPGSSTCTPPPSPVAASETQAGSSPPAVITLHRCHFCQQTFPREDLLREHQKTHQRDAPMPFRCRWCQKGFRYRQNYTLHVEKQTCRLLNGEAGGGVGSKPPGTMPPSMARPIAVANKRSAW